MTRRGYCGNSDTLSRCGRYDPPRGETPETPCGKEDPCGRDHPSKASWGGDLVVRETTVRTLPPVEGPQGEDETPCGVLLEVKTRLPVEGLLRRPPVEGFLRTFPAEEETACGRRPPCGGRLQWED